MNQKSRKNDEKWDLKKDPKNDDFGPLENNAIYWRSQKQGPKTPQKRGVNKGVQKQVFLQILLIFYWGGWFNSNYKNEFGLREKIVTTRE